MSEEQYKKMLLYFRDMKQHSLADMSELAELDVDDYADKSDECKLMNYGLYKIIRHGSGRDLADAIKHYISYNVASKMISLPR